MFLPMFSGMAILGYGAYIWAKPLVRPARFEISHDKLGKAIVTYNHDPKVIGGELRAKFGAENVSDELLNVVDNALSRSRTRAFSSARAYRYRGGAASSRSGSVRCKLASRMDPARVHDVDVWILLAQAVGCPS